MVAEKNQIYRCPVCGNIVEVVHVGGGTLVCCGKEMELLEEKTQDAELEKHVPVIEKTEKGVLVKVGSVAHPMEEAHYIEWIELIVISTGKVCKQFLKPGDAPEALFPTHVELSDVVVREYCNVHGLWKM